MIEDVKFDRLFDAYDEFCTDIGNDDGDGSARGLSMVVVMTNLIMVIFFASCYITPKQSYW
jgi:hypothetical protein